MTYKKYHGLNQSEINDELIIACSKNDFSTAKYLLTSNDLNYKAQINYINENGKTAANNAIRFDDLKLFKYLLSSSELIEKADIHEQEDLLFIIAITHHFYEVLKFLIIDMNLARTKEVNKFTTAYVNGFAEELFTIRELHNEINVELLNNDIIEEKLIKV